MDTVAIARIIPGSETDSDAEFEVLSVIAGEGLVSKEQRLRVNYFGKAKENQRFLLMGVDPPDLLWSSPLPVSDVAIRYIEKITELPKEAMARLQFYMQYLEHSDSMLARDAYDEFAKAPYGDIQALEEHMDRQQLLEWIKDTSLPPDRRRLYLVMLGVCGEPADARLLEEMLTSEDVNQRAGLDAMIACYVTLKGAGGLDLVDKLFLSNKQSQYADTYAAIMALRFHGTDGDVLERERLLESMRLILDRPELADLVIPDLARWEDWSQIDKLVELFKSADEKSSWVRVPVINYLRACPLPEAEEKLATLKEIDPAAFKRATSFFPVPKAGDGARTMPTTPGAASVVLSPAGLPRSGLPQSDLPARLQPGNQLASAVPAPVAVSAGTATATLNRGSVIGVIAMASVTIWLAMWLSISGAGRHGGLVRVLYRLEMAAKR